MMRAFRGEENQTMGEQYYKGVLAAFLGANFFSGIVSEWQIDMVKEYISHFCERQIG